MKRFLKICTLLCVVTAMSACSPKTSESEMSFEEYTQTLIPEMMSPTSSVINALYEHPENYGLIPETYEHSFMSLEDFNEAIEDDKKILETLKMYDYESLTLDEKITYDLLQNYTEKDLKLENLYYVINNNFDVNRGLHAGLTLDLYFYNFRNTQDIDSFIHLLSTADDAFDKYIEFEKERQEKNVGMSLTYLEHVIHII